MKHYVWLALLNVTVVSAFLHCQRTAAQPPEPLDIDSLASSFSSRDLETRRQAAQLAIQQPDFRLLIVLQGALSDVDPVVRQRAAQAMQLLKSPDEVTRREIVRRFEGRGTAQDVATIAGLLNDPDHEVRNQVGRILYENLHADASAVLRGVLEHKDPKLRFYATARLERVSAAEALPPLVIRLEDLDQEVRHRAMHVLRQLPAGAGDAIILAAFQHRDSAIRHAAADYFNIPANQQRTPAAVDVLAKALSDSNNSVRQRAAAALRASPHQRATSILLAAMKHVDPEVRRQAVSRLHDVADPQLINPLIAALDDLDQPVRALAVAGLNRVDDPRAKAAAQAGQQRDANFDRNKLLADAKTPDQLCALFVHRDNEVRRRAAEALRRIDGNEATQVTLSSLGNPDPEVRRHLIERLRERPDAAAVSHLRKALTDNDQYVRQYVVGALRSTPGDEALQACLAAFGHDDHLVRQRVVERFRDQGDARAVPLLIKALDDWDQYVRRESAQALRRMDDEQARQASLAAFDHADVEVRNHAIYRFAERPDVRALPALLHVLNQGDSRSWNAAAYAVRRIEDESAAQAALTLFSHPDAGVRNHAVARFQERPDARATADLARALQDRDLNVRRQAAVSLRKTPGEAATQAAVAAFDHPDEQVRLHLVYRFIELPDPNVTPKLIQKLDDEDEGVRRHAVIAIGQSATANTPEPLVPLLNHSDAELRRLIAAKLKPILADPQRKVESPLSTEQTIKRMESIPHVVIDTPAPFIEMIGGDRIVAEVIGGGPYAASADGRTQSLVIKPSHLTVQQGSQGEDSPSRAVRIHTRWIRRIVWQSQGRRRYNPGVVFLRSGNRIDYRSQQWRLDDIAVLNDDGIQRIPYREIAELHLPDYDPWVAYCEQLAVLGCTSTERVVRMDCLDGSHVMASTGRFMPFSDVESGEPNEWKHAIHPAWSLDPLVAPRGSFRLRCWLPATETPLVQPRGEDSGGIWPWRTDRSVRGDRLKSGARQYVWGFGVHADNLLRFPLPRFATGVRLEVGLDQTVGDRGCARAIVRLRVRDNLSEIYRSPLIIGARTVHDVGAVKIPALDADAYLELVADSAGGDRPANADPLNISDFVDWLEPRLLLDEGQLSEAIAAAAAQLARDQFNATAPSTNDRALSQ